MQMRWCFALLVIAIGLKVEPVLGQAQQRVELSCHRTANEDLPENTLESLEEAALLGCDIIEIDVRKTLDGKLVLQHDGFLERLTDGVGEVEETYYDDLRLRDVGGWMGDRFRGMKIALLVDALRFARETNVRLYLDIKDKGISVEVLRLVEHEDMLERVQFGGESDDLKQLPLNAYGENTVSVEPGVSSDEVKKAHGLGKTVFANFSANGHGMDLTAMKAAVAAGVDVINVDYPRLGADAVGRPVEQRLTTLAESANLGDSSARVRAILALSHYRGFPLRREFAHWLLDPDNHVSRAAAVALVIARPQTPASVFVEALESKNTAPRANAAWALGVLGAPAAMLIPLLKDDKSQVLEETLVALAHMPGYVKVDALLPLLSNPVPSIRGATALALAAHQPNVALSAVRSQLKIDQRATLSIYDAWVQRGGTLTQDEIRRIVQYYRCQVKEILAVSMLKGPSVTRTLEEEAFRPGKDFAEMNGIMSAFLLWDRVGEVTQPALAALGAKDSSVADRAEWMLIQSGPSVLPEIRKALRSPNTLIRDRAIRIVAWQGDIASIAELRKIQRTVPEDEHLVSWAIEKIQMLHPKV